MLWIIAYDIAHPRRLRRTARVLERDAQRVQKSVFVFDGSELRLQELLERAAAQIDPQADRLQAWRLASRHPSHDYGGQANLLPLARALVAAPAGLFYVRPAFDPAARDR